jgi:hypothetical protein
MRPIEKKKKIVTETMKPHLQVENKPGFLQKTGLYTKTEVLPETQTKLLFKSMRTYFSIDYLY